MRSTLPVPRLMARRWRLLGGFPEPRRRPAVSPFEDSSGDDSDSSLASLFGSAGDAISDCDDGWLAVPGDDLSVVDQQGGALPNDRLSVSSADVEHFDGVPVHDAYL